jgi:putative inorganic carbon (hco3(-)) transporter
VADTRPALLVRPRPLRAGAALWAGRLAACAAAFAAGTLLARTDRPLPVIAAAVVGALAVAAAVVRPRWCLVAALALLVAYLPDVVAGPKAAHAVIVIVVVGALVRWATGRERLAVPGEMGAFGALVLAFAVATVFAGDRAAAQSETIDLVSYAAVVALVVALLDTPRWLRRALWAIAVGVGLLALLAIVQQLTHSFGSTYRGLATVLPEGDTMRSAGPLNPNPFGQVLVTAAVLAFYLWRTHRGFAGRVLAAAIAIACVVAVGYTQSRAALIALMLVALGIGYLSGIRLRVLVVAVVGVIAIGTAVLPQELQTRVEDLYGAISANAGTPQDTSLRGRKSENLAGIRMWADHPLIGVGPDNFEVNYLRYSERIGTDPRPEERGAHNLYLESLAETGVLGAAAFFTVLWLSLRGAWRARQRLRGRDALLGEGVFVALCAFLICALTLHSAYARYQWIFLGLGLAAGRLARRPAR